MALLAFLWQRRQSLGRVGNPRHGCQRGTQFVFVPGVDGREGTGAVLPQQGSAPHSSAERANVAQAPELAGVLGALLPTPGLRPLQLRRKEHAQTDRHTRPGIFIFPEGLIQGQEHHPRRRQIFPAAQEERASGGTSPRTAGSRRACCKCSRRGGRLGGAAWPAPADDCPSGFR